MSNSQHWKRTLPPHQFNFPQVQRSGFCGQRRRRSCTCLISRRLFPTVSHVLTADLHSMIHREVLLQNGTTQAGEQHSGAPCGNEVSALHSSISSALPCCSRHHSQRQCQRGNPSPLKHAVRLTWPQTVLENLTQNVEEKLPKKHPFSPSCTAVNKHMEG